MPDDAQVDPDETIAALRRELAARTAERDEALDQQTATAEVLQVINSSPGDLAPVFDAILEKAHILCGAAHGSLQLCDGENLRAVATHAVSDKFAEALRQGYRAADSPASRVLMEGEHFIQIADCAEIDHPVFRSAAELSGIRTVLFVPLRKDDAFLGLISAARLEVRPFTDKQIALLQNFAAQAVIAMENARLLGELRRHTQELTQRETALRESEERYALAMRAINEGVYEWDVATGEMYYSPRVCELVGLQAAELRTMTDWTDRIHPDDRELFRRAIIAHFKGETDRLDAEYRYRHADRNWHWARQHGIALKNEAGRAYRVVGSTGDITDRKTAEEALREALEQQTATAEVLQVINASPGDLAPVFDAMLDRAMRLCGGAQGTLWMFDGERMRAAATAGYSAELAQQLQEWREIHPFQWRLAHGERVFQILDLAAEELYLAGNPLTRAAVDIGGIRTAAFVALVKDATTMGGFTIGRPEVRAFTEKEIALLENFAAQAVVAMENARLLTETREALEQQTATAEVLQVINSSPGDLAPVFDAILEKAHTLCSAAIGALVSFDGEHLQALAIRGMPAAFDDFVRQPFLPHPKSIEERLVREQRLIHVPDVQALGSLPDNPISRAAIRLGDIRTALFVPLQKDAEAAGYIAAARAEVRPFTDKQIALLQNFAAQAVIAMENARLLTETREALEQQTATAEVLQVINSSPGDLAPVFDAMLEKAHALCGAELGSLVSYDGEHFHALTTHGYPAEYATVLREPFPPSTFHRALINGEHFVHIANTAAIEREPGNEPFRRAVETSGAGTVVLVPLRKDDTLLGLISAARKEVRPFTDKQIALLQNFAAQAVIAMENARLLTETREALEQQTATAEVLQVINSSPGDLAPVFDAVLDKALRLCGAAFGAFFTWDGEGFLCAATRGFPPALLEFYRDRLPRRAGSAMERLVEGQSTSQVTDIRADALQSPVRRALADLGGARTMIWVALRKEKSLLGCIAIYRQEVQPFTEKEIALLENFAAQAVIAMENARLLTETREALEQQTATAEVLQVINSSPGDLTPVFDAMLEKAMRLCDASFGHLLTSADGDVFTVAAAQGPPAVVEFLRNRPPTRPGSGTSMERLVRGERCVHVHDAMAEEAYRRGDPTRRAMVDLGGCRTFVSVGLRKDDALLGAITVYRGEVKPFSTTEIALIENFAAQAVIAIENARLLTETREALEQQTATAEVLQVINSSPGNLPPVFDTMLEKAMRLCEAAFGMIHTFDGTALRLVAQRGIPPLFAEFAANPANQPGPGGATPRLIRDPALRFVHVIDAKEEEAYRSGDPFRRALVEIGGARTMLAIPLRKDGVMVGVINIYRKEVRAYTEREIAVMGNFAAQAVIAMENARLLDELRQRTSDLQESLEYQTATSDVLQVISRSTFDLQPVLDTLVQTAVRLCGADMAGLLTRDGDVYRRAADYGVSPEWAAITSARAYQPGRDNVVALALLEKRVVHVTDIAAEHLATPGAVTVGKVRTALGVPLLREGEPIGVILLARQRVEPFTERQIELVRTFADQAVIAIENTRLITETREALEQQTATAEILQVINSSPGDLAPVFDTMLEKAMQLCGAAFGELHTFDGARFHTAAQRGGPPEFVAVKAKTSLSGRPGTASGRILETRRTLHIPDLKAEDAYRTGQPTRRDSVDLGGIRTLLAVPLLKDDNVVGLVAIYRHEVRPFSGREIALLESFAAQAVIAMDNARLLNEIRQRQAELRVTFDNMGDGVAMFDGELRLAAWNLNFQRILEVPDALLAERPRVAELVRYLATHGEYGAVDIEAEVRRLSERVGTQWSNERTRPDGRVIEVRSNPVPGGGVVLIYSDVTERKRAEAEIRAARDTAERALQELQTAQASLLHAQKMAALGQLTAGIAHEIKNPLNFVNNFAELSGELLLELKETTAPAVAALGDDERAAVDEVVEMLRGNLDKIAEHGKRADGIVKSMLEHSRGVSGERRVVDLNALIEEALNLAYHGARAQDASFNITLEREFDRGLAPTELAPQEMTRVFLNLFGNGFYATAKRQRDDAGAGFRPTLRVATSELGDAVEVRVRDNGTGIAPEIRDKLFQPFVTTKPTGEGTGLGLSIAYDIVTQQHAGTIEVDSVPGEFTEFTIRLPHAG
jgi:PAS domain S-box-containing protein